LKEGADGQGFCDKFKVRIFDPFGEFTDTCQRMQYEEKGTDSEESHCMPRGCLSRMWIDVL
jgi:hypothetical protein